MIESTADRATREATERSTQTLTRLRSRTRAIPKQFGETLFSGPVSTRTQGTAPDRGAEGVLRAYSTSPWLRAVTGRIGYIVASVPWKISRRTRSQGADVEEIEEHPFLDFLENEIPDKDLALEDPSRLTGFDTRLTMQVATDLVGESFGLVESTLVGNLPTEMQPIPPHWVKRTPKRGQASYIVRAPRTAVDIEIPSEFMTWIRDPNPHDPYGRGTGIGIALGDEIETDEYMARHTKNLFFNGARPDLLMVAEGAKQSEIDRFKENWQRELQGYWNSFKVHAIGRKVEVHDLSRNLKDMSFAPLRELERNAFIHVYGMPPEILGIVENSNRATIDAADLLVTKYIAVPRLMRWKVHYQRIARKFDEGLIVDFENPIPDDKDGKRSTMVAMPHAFRVNEWRELANEDPLEEEDGGELFLGGAVTIANESPAGGALDTDEPEDEEDPPGPPDEEEDEDEDSEERSTRGVNKISSDDIERIIQNMDIEDLVDEVRPIARSTVMSFATESLAVHSDTPLVISERVRRYINEISASRIRGVGRTVRTRIRREMVESLLAGESQKELERRISSVFRSASGPRARVIARTESVAASTFGTQEGLLQGGVERKEWLSSRDDAVRETHAPGTGLDGQVVATLADFVSPSGARGQGPGQMSTAEESVACRCTILAVLGTGRSSLGEVAKTAIWKAADRKRLPFERRYLRSLSKAFRKMRNSILSEIR